MTKKLNILIYSICILFCFTSTLTAQHFLFVKGKVVDDLGKPVENALVAMSGREVPDAIDWLILGDKTDSKGNFEIKTYTNSKRINTYLFVSSPKPRNAANPIDAPFSILHKQNPNSKGIPITLNKDKPLDVGDIKIQVWLNLVEILVEDNQGKPYYKKQEDWYKFIYLIRNKDGVLASGLSLSINDVDRKVNLEKGSYLIALPEGTWSVEIIEDWEDLDKDNFKSKKFLAKSEGFTINRNDEQKIIKLIIK